MSRDLTPEQRERIAGIMRDAQARLAAILAEAAADVGTERAREILATANQQASNVTDEEVRHDRR